MFFGIFENIEDIILIHIQYFSCDTTEKERMEFYSVQEQEAGLGAGPHHDISWEDERPPTYNPEDYSAHLTRSGLSLNINHHCSFVMKHCPCPGSRRPAAAGRAGWSTRLTCSRTRWGSGSSAACPTSWASSCTTSRSPTTASSQSSSASPTTV